MGIVRGNIENQSLGALAEGVKGAAGISLNSVQSGLHAYADGLIQYAKSYTSLANGLGEWAKFFNKMAGYTVDSRNAVKKNDEQEAACADELRQIGEREGTDSDNYKVKMQELEEIHGRRSTLGFMMFGSDPRSDSGNSVLTNVRVEASR